MKEDDDYKRAISKSEGGLYLKEICFVTINSEVLFFKIGSFKFFAPDSVCRTKISHVFIK